MACKRRMVSRGWFEEDFSGRQADKVRDFIQGRRDWLKDIFDGICPPPCKLKIRERVSQSPIFSSASAKKFTVRYEFEVTCE